MKRVYLILFLLTFSLFNTSAYAVSTPGFPICSNPQGTLIVDYREGVHGIVGSLGEFRGSDKVYSLSDTTLVQCFCPENGDGIQTNWWKVSALTDSDIQILKRQGWNYIANGALWGLEAVPYLAINSSYSCKGVGGVGGGEVLAGTGGVSVLYTVALLGIVTLVIGILKSKNA